MKTRITNSSKIGFKLIAWFGLVLLLAACGDDTNTAPVANSTPVASTPPASLASSTTPASPTNRPATPTTTPASPATTPPPATATTKAATTAPVPATTAVTAPTAAGGDEAAQGLVIFKSQGCAGCHGGEKATGDIGPSLIGIRFPVEGLLRQVRNGAAPMPAYSAEKLPDSDVKLIYAYLKSLK